MSSGGSIHKIPFWNTAHSGFASSIAANRLSYVFDLHGPSMTIDTACSSSLVAFHQACQSIRTRETDVALVAGISLHLHKTHCLTGTSGIPHRSAVPRSPQCAALRRRRRRQDGGAERWPVSFWQVAAPGCERPSSLVRSSTGP
jgi:acetyl-CoA acetyltransferase